MTYRLAIIYPLQTDKQAVEQSASSSETN